MTWNKPMAPECESAPGSPHDSICMTVATRVGSSPKRADHAMILSCQWRTAGAKRRGKGNARRGGPPRRGGGGRGGWGGSAPGGGGPAPARLFGGGGGRGRGGGPGAGGARVGMGHGREGCRCAG